MIDVNDAELFDRLTADTPLELEDGTVVQIPPHPDFGFLGDDQLDAYAKLQFEIKDYDREDDVVVRPAVKRQVDGVEIPAKIVRGPLVQPHQKDGQPIRPPYRVRVVKAALGKETYAKIKAGGRGQADVWRIWAVQAATHNEHRAAN